MKRNRCSNSPFQSGVSLDIQPQDVFHRLKAWRLYLVLLKKSGRLRPFSCFSWGSRPDGQNFWKTTFWMYQKFGKKTGSATLSTGVGLCLFWIIWNYDTMSCHHHLKVSYFFPSHWGRFRGVIIKTPTTLVVKIQIHCSTTAEAHTRPGFLDAEAHLRRGGRRCQGAHVTGTNQHVEAPRMLRRCITS